MTSWLSPGELIPRDSERLACKHTLVPKPTNSESIPPPTSFYQAPASQDTIPLPGPGKGQLGIASIAQSSPKLLKASNPKHGQLFTLTRLFFSVEKNTIKVLAHTFTLLLLPLGQPWYSLGGPARHTMPPPLGNCESQILFPITQISLDAGFTEAQWKQNARYILKHLLI